MAFVVGCVTAIDDVGSPVTQLDIANFDFEVLTLRISLVREELKKMLTLTVPVLSEIDILQTAGDDEKTTFKYKTYNLFKKLISEINGLKKELSLVDPRETKLDDE